MSYASFFSSDSHPRGRHVVYLLYTLPVIVADPGKMKGGFQTNERAVRVVKVIQKVLLIKTGMASSPFLGAIIA